MEKKVKKIIVLGLCGLVFHPPKVLAVPSHSVLGPLGPGVIDPLHGIWLPISGLF